MKLNRYEIELLKAVVADKAGGDLSTLFKLQQYGLLKIEPSPGNLTITITEAGRTALASQ